MMKYWYKNCFLSIQPIKKPDKAKLSMRRGRESAGLFIGKLLKATGEIL